MKNIFFLALCLSLLSVYCYADVEVGAKDWEDTLANNPQTLVKFYSPYCGWCQKFAPLWTELTQAFDGALNVIAVDVTVNQALASEQGVTGVPAVKLYNGKKNLADYKGARTQNDITEWLFEHLLPLQLEYNTKAWSRYTQTSYSHPTRFVYVYAADEKPDTEKMYEAIHRKGIFAEAAIPRDKVSSFLSSYQLKSLPVLATVHLGVLTAIESSEVDKAIKNSKFPTKAEAKSFGNDATADTHSTFTLLFFVIALGGLAVFVWKKLGPQRRQLDMAKTV